MSAKIGNHSTMCIILSNPRNAACYILFRRRTVELKSLLEFMILIFLLLVGASVFAASPQRPVNLHECSTVKFDLNDLDNALHMYKTCSALSSTLNEDERGIYLESLRSKMDTACLSLILACGVNVNDWNRNKRSTRVNNFRKQKLYKIMNYLTDLPAAGNVSFRSPDTDMDSRVRRGLIHTIQERVNSVHERLTQRCSAVKRSPEGSMDGEFKAHFDEPTTTPCATHESTYCRNSEKSTIPPPSGGRFSAEFVVGNIGFVVIIVFAVSAICCFVSLLLCKVCCLTDCSIAAIHWWSKGKQQRQENAKKCKKKNKKKKQIKDCPSSE